MELLEREQFLVELEATLKEVATGKGWLLSGVKGSAHLSPVQKLTLAVDITTIQQLGQIDKTPEVIEAARSKIDAVTAVFSPTADMVSLGMVVIPIVRAWFGF